MKRAARYLFPLLLLSIPLWVKDPYFLHVLIMTGIFTIAAMSLNLLLGYTGQLSLGHVGFLGIGAYASALVSLGCPAPQSCVPSQHARRRDSPSTCCFSDVNFLPSAVT